MTLHNLCNTNTVEIYEINTTHDNAQGVVETLGVLKSEQHCRVVDVDSTVRAEFEKYDLHESCLFIFPHDPAMQVNDAIVWNNKIWRALQIDVVQPGNRWWEVLAEYVPQIEIPT